MERLPKWGRSFVVITHTTLNMVKEKWFFMIKIVYYYLFVYICSPFNGKTT